MALQIGDRAPDFTLPADTAEPITLSKLRGHTVVLYFYPKDNTPGCTKEACLFRDHYELLQKKGVTILGVSKDTPETHNKFKKKHHLPFTLLTDKDADVCEAYGVINKKSLFGKTFLGIQRSTFLINQQGIIQAIWRKVNIAQHVEDILHELK
jgi:peroxiredoxin Q/BCP